jgi:hypothetical protein
MKRLLFVVLMMSCSVAWADWEFTGESNGGAIRHYHDKSTLRRDGVIAKMWTMNNFSREQENTADKMYSSSKSLVAFNCKNEGSAVVSIVQYSGSMGDGAVVWTAARKDTALEWGPIVPESVLEKFWKIGCQKK